MKLRLFVTNGTFGILLAGARLVAVDGGATSAAARVTPNAADGTLQSDSLPGSVVAWDGLMKTVDIVADAGPAHFVFNVTNISTVPVVIQEVQPSCGCTTAQLPPLPWTIPPGAGGQLGFTVQLLGKARKQVKTVDIRTDKGFKTLTLGINVMPPVVPAQSRTERVRSLELAKADRQAIFRGDCVVCHVKPAEGKEDGRALYYSMCAVCHEGKDRAANMPDLFAIKTPVDVGFWLNWIAHSKSGSPMPAFSKAEGGPLSEMQIAYLARYLNTTDEMDPP